MKLLKLGIAAVVSTFLLASCGTQLSDGRIDIKVGVDASGKPSVSLETGFDLKGPSSDDADLKATEAKKETVAEPAEIRSAQSTEDRDRGDGAKIGTSLALSATKADTMALVIQVAQDEGIDPLDFLALAWTESALDPMARAEGSTAKGVLQFVDRTAKAYGLTDPFDAEANLRAGARLWKDNAAHLTRALGRTPAGSELYLAHMQGAGTAVALIKGGDTLAATISGRAAIALNLPSGSPKNPTAEQFVAIWQAKFQKNRSLFTRT